MYSRRLSIVLLTLIATFAATQTADAGCCDWLFGRKPAYVVGYPVQPVVAAPAPAACPQPVITQRVAMPAQPCATCPTQPVLGAGVAPPIAVTNGAYQAQRPAYFENPSVYSGAPVVMAPGPTTSSLRLPIAPAAQVVPTAAYRPVMPVAQANPVVPITRAYRGIAPAATGNPIYGTGNIYPSNYQARYQAASPVVTTTPACPTNACAQPACPVPAPVVVAAPPKKCCLSRFFGSCWGNTNYQTTYYRAPITYYRPVTTVSPVTGVPVTVQQPCTSTVQQIQRTPYNMPFTPSAPAGGSTTTIAPMTGSGCNSCSSTPAPSTYLGPTGSGIGQTGGVTSPSDQSTVPIPSIDPSYSPNTQPLQGAPSNGGDLQNVPQPRLESARPTIETQPQPTPKTNESYWGARDNTEKTALNSLQQNGGTQSDDGRYSNLRPIEAPSGYQAPQTSAPSASFPSTAPVSKTLTAPPLLPVPSKAYDLRDTNSASLRLSVPVHEATMTRTRSKAVAPAQRVRDSGGWTANN